MSDLRLATCSSLSSVPMKVHFIVFALLCAPVLGAAARQGVRVVDSVDVTAAGDEARHAFAGEDTSLGEAAGRNWRSATGWFTYSLRIYDDSPLTLVFAFADSSGDRESFDILVDGTKVATVDHEAGRRKAEEWRFDVPFAQTKGKTSVTVRLRARAGARTSRVLEVCTVQEHLE